MTGSAAALVRLGGVIAAGVVVAGVAGCASSGSSTTVAGSGPTSASVPASAATGSSATGMSSPTGAGSPSASTGGTSSAAPGCTTADLSVKAGDSEGAAGSVYTTLDFTNTGSTDCTLYGYPGVSLASGSPATQVGAAASRSTTASPTLVTLKPGDVGNALLRITQALNYPSASCSPSSTTYLRIYPPGQTASILLAYKAMGCSKTGVNLLTISVVQAGAKSSQ